jgi:hypothetical protein
MRGRRPRTSTIVLAGLFLAVLALYILVRPVPPRRRSGRAGRKSCLPAQPRAVRPRAVTQPVSYPEPEPFAQAG